MAPATATVRNGVVDGVQWPSDTGPPPSPTLVLSGDIATAVLCLGTTPFVLATGVLLQSSAVDGGAEQPAALLTTDERSAVCACLVSYAAMILAFIGGLQQAAALAGGEPRLVVAGVGVALLGWLMVVRQQLRTAGVLAGRVWTVDPRAELLLLALFYGWQARLTRITFAPPQLGIETPVWILPPRA
jgi:hypothetical protein